MKRVHAESKSLKFIIGALHGFVVRHDRSLMTSPQLDVKSDYQISIQHYLKDGGVYRFNHITIKTKFNAPGGIGPERLDKSRRAAFYLKKLYPDIITIFERKNGTTEVKLKNLPYLQRRH